MRAIVSAGGRRRTYGLHRPGGKVTGPVVRVLGVQVALDEDELRAGRADRPPDRERLGLARGPGLPLRRAGAVRRARPAHERRRGDAAGARRLARASRGALAPALPACRRVAQRSLLRPRARRRRQRRLRALHRPPAHAGRAPDRRRALDEHLAGLQLPRRRRRRLGRQLVRELEHAQRRRLAPVPRLRRAVPLPRLGSRVHRVAEPHRQAGRLPVRRRRRERRHG